MQQFKQWKFFLADRTARKISFSYKRAFKKSKKSHIHYLSCDIQNEPIDTMSIALSKELLQRIKIAKYYAVTLEWISEQSHQEQISLSIKYIVKHEDLFLITNRAALKMRSTRLEFRS